MDLRTTRHLLVAIILHMLIQTSAASVSFPAIQAIVDFSPSCTAAYGTTVNNCDINDFPGLGASGSCSSDCESALQLVQGFVQHSCRGQQADANSLIGQLFLGNIVDFLCSPNPAVATTATTAAASSTAPMTTAADSATSSMSAGQGASGTASATLSGTVGTTTEGSTGTSSPTSKATSLFPSRSMTTVDSDSPSSSSTSTAASSTRTSASGGSGDDGGDDGDSGGGSPFDATFSSEAGLSLSKALQPHVLLLCLIALIFATL